MFYILFVSPNNTFQFSVSGKKKNIENTIVDCESAAYGRKIMVTWLDDC